MTRQYVNLLNTKESNQKKRKLTTLIRYTAIGLCLLTFILSGLETVILLAKKGTLENLNKEKRNIEIFLKSKKGEANLAYIISQKSQVIKQSSKQEVDFYDFYEKGLQFLPSETGRPYLSKIKFDKFGSGIFELSFNNFDTLNSLIQSVENSSQKNNFKSFRIEKVTVNEGTPSSSLVQLKLQFK